jgi:hypothetical protein
LFDYLPYSFTFRSLLVQLMLVAKIMKRWGMGNGCEKGGGGGVGVERNM